MKKIEKMANTFNGHSTTSNDNKRPLNRVAFKRREIKQAGGPAQGSGNPCSKSPVARRSGGDPRSERSDKQEQKKKSLLISTSNPPPVSKGLSISTSEQPIMKG